MVQLPFGAMVAPAAGLMRMPTSPAPRPPPPESCRVPAVLPAVHVLLVVSGALNVIAPGVVGKTSENDTPVKLIGFVPGLAITMVSVEVPPVAMDEGAKLLVIVGGLSTFSVAVAGAV